MLKSVFELRVYVQKVICVSIFYTLKFVCVWHKFIHAVLQSDKLRTSQVQQIQQKSWAPNVKSMLMKLWFASSLGMKFYDSISSPLILFANWSLLLWTLYKNAHTIFLKEVSKLYRLHDVELWISHDTKMFTQYLESDMVERASFID